jgi:hypothetical protein
LRTKSAKYAGEELGIVSFLCFDLDIVGTCNLRCPSCPNGNAPELRSRSGIMAPRLLEAILDKALGECEPALVSLFNWTEPLLHRMCARVPGSVDECLAGFERASGFQ